MRADATRQAFLVIPAISWEALTNDAARHIAGDHPARIPAI